MWLVVVLLLILWRIDIPVISDIGHIFSNPIKTVKAVVDAVWKALKRAVTWASGIFNRVGDAWFWLHDAFNDAIQAWEDFAAAAYGTFKWLGNTLVPKWARKAVQDAIKWAVDNIKALANKALKLAGHALNWAKTAIKDVRSWVRKQLSAIRRDVSKLISWVKKTGNRIADLVLHPKRMVRWILGDLVEPVLRWILSHLAAVATLIGRWIFSNIGLFARELETAIHRIF